MPRTIDSILSSHQAAQELRKQGKSAWKYTVNIQALIEAAPEEKTVEYLAKFANDVADLLKKHLPKEWFDVNSDNYNSDIDEIVDVMSGWDADTYSKYCADAGCDESSLVDGWLDQLYDIADRERIWLRG